MKGPEFVGSHPYNHTHRLLQYAQHEAAFKEHLEASAGAKCSRMSAYGCLLMSSCYTVPILWALQ